MNTKLKIFICIFISIVFLFLSIAIGSVQVTLKDIVLIILQKLNVISQSSSNEVITSIIWDIRLPRVLIAFLAGGALAVSGAILQSMMKNPLASPYTLGVSAGAGVGAAFVMVLGINIPFLGNFSLSFFTLLSGVITIYLVVSLSYKVDKSMSSTTIILMGMVFALFFNAIILLISSLNRNIMQQISLWQMGTFSMREWNHILILLPICVICSFILIRFLNELDIMSFGEEQAATIGIDVVKTKWTLIFISAILASGVVSVVGIIGFVDLIAPHIARKIFGPSHKFVIPISALFGGTIMVVSDLIARTIIYPIEISVGAITAIIGAPFFAYVFFTSKGRA